MSQAAAVRTQIFQLFLLRKAMPIQWHFLLSKDHQVRFNWQCSSNNLLGKHKPQCRTQSHRCCRSFTALWLQTNIFFLWLPTNHFFCSSLTPEPQFLTKLLISNIIQKTRVIFAGTGNISRMLIRKNHHLGNSLVSESNRGTGSWL